MLKRLITKLNQGLVYIAVKLLHGYRYLLSPWIGNQCRFYPSCSHYSEEAIIKHGFLTGTYLTLRRLLKCHPWHAGGLDPVPEVNKTCCSSTHSHTTDGSH
ncbi:membrane protein insertion efficiency factor YidD [Cellvibrio sp. BR]|jgi:putative membrane protein insertion efficiency factor|uniref:membrane protein insertion efficiency factor YidD n=1 Tax=Cellvibrio sp. BR TaxID=1134474 RepID=UPI0026BB2A86